jgi:hypothetical protein
MELSSEVLFPKMFMGILGDAAKVAKKADAFASAVRWRWWQNIQAGGFAVGSSLIPVTGFVTTPASMVFTYRKMAHVAWGIGYYLNAEIEPLDDVLLITGLWSGAVKREALSVGRFSAPILSTAAVGLAGVAVHAFNAKAVDELAIKELIKKYLPRFGEHLGRKLAADGAKQATSRAVPLIGPVVSGGLTLYSMSGFATKATEFYTRKRELTGPAR